jgi:hypothetical protein
VHYNKPPDVIQPLNSTVDLDTARCPTCGRSFAPFRVRRSALLDVLTILLDVASEARDADGCQLLVALARDAKAAAEEVAL